MAEYIEGKWKHFSFRMVDPHTDIPRVLENLKIILCPESMKCVGYEDYMFEDWEQIFAKILNDGNNLSFMAEDEDGNIAGMRVTGLHKKCDPDEVPDFKHQHTIDIWNFFVGIGKKAKIFETYPDVTEYADMFGVSVDPKHRQQGLANEIYRRSLVLLKAKGLKLAKCTFSSPFSRKAGLKNGFKELARSTISEAKKANGTPLNPHVDPDLFVDAGVFELDKIVL